MGRTFQRSIDISSGVHDTPPAKLHAQGAHEQLSGSKAGAGAARAGEGAFLRGSAFLILADSVWDNVKPPIHELMAVAALRIWNGSGGELS